MTSEAESQTRLHERRLLAARLAWLLFALTGLMSALSFVFLALSWATPVPDTWGFRGDAMLLALAFGGIGLLLARRHPQNPIGWLLLSAGLINSILEFCVEYATYAMLTKPGELPYGTLAAWIASWLWVIGIAILIYVFLLFPTGHLPSAGWRPVAWFFVTSFGLLSFAFMIRPGSLYFAPYLNNPFAVPVADRVLGPLPPAATAAAVFLVGLSVILRLRRAEGVERQQLKWFAYAATLRAIFGISDSLAEAVGLKGTDPKFFEYLSVALWIAIAVAIAFAILRYRLWDIDILINRTLVYGALSASIVGFYVLIVGWLSISLQTQNYLPSSVFALLIIAFLFQPLRQRLQGIADRFVPVQQSALLLEQHESKIASPELEGTADTTLRGHGLFSARDIPGPNHEIAASQPNSKRWFMLAHFAWSVCAALALLIFLAAIPLGYAQRFSGTFGVPIDAPGWYIAVMSVAQAVVSMLMAVVCLALAAILFWKRRQEPMTLFVSFFLLAYGIVMAGPLEALNGLPLVSAGPSSHRSMVISVDVVYKIQTALFAVMPLLFYLFPSGRFVPGWTRYLALLVLLLVPVVIRTFSADWPSTVTPSAWGFAALMGVGIYAQIYRYRRVATPLERQQTKWVVFGVALTFISLTVLQIPYSAATAIPAGVAHPWWQPLTGLGWFLSLTILPLSLAIAVLRYRLWDVDILINRTLVYGALTASVVGLYVLIVGGLSIGLQTQTTLPGIIIALLVIAFVFQPLRQWLQRIADRFVYVPQSALALEPREHKPTIPEGQGAADTILSSRWLLIARLAWMAVFLTLTIMYAFGFLAVQSALSTVCEDELCTLRQQIRPTEGEERIEGWPGPPIGFAEPLHPHQVRAVETLGITLDQYGWLGALQMGIPALIYLLIAAGLFWRRSDNWMVLFASIMVATFPLQDMPLPFTLAVRQPDWEWVRAPSQVVALSCFLIFPLIFPNGRFVPRWTRWMVLFVLTGAVLAALFQNSIWEIPGAIDLAGLFVVISFGTGVYAQVYRYFRVATPVERQQLKWVVVGLAGFIIMTFLMLTPLHELLISRAASMDPARALLLLAIPDTLFHLISLFIPVSIVISVLRFRLWDIDILINRTLVYGALTGIVVSAFVIIVGFLGTFFQSSGNSIIAIIATGLVALLFNPLRQRLQRGVNHLMYGDRDDPYAALARLGRRLETSLAPEAVLPTVVSTVREVLKLPYVAIYLQQDLHGYKIVAESASPSLRMEGGRIRVPGMEREGRCIPLIHQGETLGYIVLGPRAPNEAFSSTDLHLLEDLAPQVGVAVHAVRLAADLQRSREQLVLAREEERRRIRRDLHDGLGPQLAGVALKLETLRNRLTDDPLADSILADLAKRTQDATADIRHLVYELRPPALDELGLMSALREGATQYNRKGANEVNVKFDAPESLPALPAAVEVAVYRIAQEALANVIRHADARTCLIRIRLDESLGLLCLEIQDDGKGLPVKRRAGVGLNSMRERAEELGGTFTITSTATGGTLLTAQLPCRVSDRNAPEASQAEG
jgi:signal transduction histidine kinase